MRGHAKLCHASRHQVRIPDTESSGADGISIGLGGGSLIRESAGKVTVGPDSVGYRILDEALVFGGNTITATDVAVAAGVASKVGDASRVTTLSSTLVEGAKSRMKTMLELTLDTMKTSTAVRCRCK